MGEICWHDTCDYGDREEYCSNLAVRRDGSAAALAGLIDDLMVKSTDLAAHTAVVSSNRDVFDCHREFSYIEAAAGMLPGVFTQTAVEFSYNANRKLRQHEYRVAISWLVTSMLEEKIIGPHTTTYSLVTYDGGPAYGFVSAPDLLVDRGKVQPYQPYRIEERALTPYDCVTLANELAAIHELDDLVCPDNRESLPHDW